MSPADRGPEAPFRILAVCTGNICRSPAAEAHLRAALGPGGGVEVRSAGLHARAGAPVAPWMAELLEVPLEGFVARQLTSPEVAEADLVLTMTREQRSAVVSGTPTAVRRTFALREFAELVALAAGSGVQIPGDSAGERLAALVPLVPRFRAMRRGADDDIDDPFGGDRAGYARALLSIRTAVETIASVVTADPGSARTAPPARLDRSA